MQDYSYIQRRAEEELRASLKRDPVTAVLGPRQCGKSTLARRITRDRADAIYLDLELPSDLRKLDEPELFLDSYADHLICIDEIQLKPDLFPLLRALVDKDRRPGRFLILGSASRDLIRQKGETLAGRIHYLELTPFQYDELYTRGVDISIRTHWWRGGFPVALLMDADDDARLWLRDFIQTFLSRDVPQFGFEIPMSSLDRFWRMFAHYHGQVLNQSKIGQALDVSHNTIHRYVELMEQTFMVRVLRPLVVNTKKRLIKSPKVYIRDSGILHTLLEIDTPAELFGHPSFGCSWEGWCVEQLCQALPDWRTGYYRTSSGEEIDLILEKGQRRIAFEFKASLSPKLTRGSQTALSALDSEQAYVVCPLDEKGYWLSDHVYACGICECLDRLLDRVTS